MNLRQKPLSLKTLFALASTACVLFTVVLGYFGLTAYGDYQVAEATRKFAPEAKRAQADIEARRVPDPKDLIVLYEAYNGLEVEIESGQNWALVVLSIMAASLGACLSVCLANLLGRPIGEVAAAARQISRGELSARAATSKASVGESAQLVEDFNKMASALEGYDREMSESSAAIAHELRTPLTVLRGYVQGAIDGVFPPTPDHLALLMVHIESLSRIVDDLQTLSLAKSGALKLSKQTFDAQTEIAFLLNSMEPAISNNGFVLERALEAATMKGDPARLRQAVTALIDNAQHYAKSGGVIRVQTQETRSAVIIRVLDRGPGIAECDLSRGFERFWRAEPSRGKHSGGSGLGLSVVEAIVIAHGGEARLSNRPSGGLCVELTFPKV